MNLLTLTATVFISAFNSLNLIQPNKPFQLISPPTTYHYAIYKVGTSWSAREFLSGGAYENLPFTRTGASAPYDYYTTYSGNDDIFPEGLNVDLYFEHLTSAVSYNGVSYYITDVAAGSNNTTSIDQKVDISIWNSTTKDYKIHLDVSSTGATRTYIYNNYSVNDLERLNLDLNETTSISSTSLRSFVVPAGTWINLYASTTSSQVYLDAIYFETLSTSSSITNNDDDDFYDAGLEDGFDKTLDGFTLLNGVESLVGIILNVIFVVLGVEILGITLLDIFAIVFALVGVIWILKLIRG